MLDLVSLSLKLAPGAASALRRAFGAEEFANALTEEQGWARRLLKGRDGLMLVAVNVAEAMGEDQDVKRELGGSRAEWTIAGEEVGGVLRRAFDTRDALLQSVAHPGEGMRRCLDSGGQALIDSFREEEQAVARVKALLQCSVSVVENLVPRARWFLESAAVRQLQFADRAEALAEEAVSALDALNSATFSDHQHLDRKWSDVVKRATVMLNVPPEYYPAGFSNRLLAEDLRVTRIDERDITTIIEREPDAFDTTRLYSTARPYGRAIKLTEIVNDSPFTVLLGNPGSGKSTLARDLAAEVLKSGRLAAFARLDDLASVLESTVAPADEFEAIAAVSVAMTRTVQIEVPPKPLFKSSPDRLDRTITKEAALIVLDGLDEIPSAAGLSAVKSLVRILVDCQYRVLLTSRISGYSTPWDEATHAILLPLTTEATGRVANNWFDLTNNAKAQARYEGATSNDALSDVISNPLTLGFVCFVSHHGDIPSGEAGIFERFVDHFLRRKWHPPEQWVNDDAAVATSVRMATDVAWTMARVPRGGAQLLWSDTAVLSDLEEANSSAEAPYRTYQSGLLVPYGLTSSPISPRFQRVRWIHRVIHEHFVARRLAQKLSAHDGDWWQAFLEAVLHPAAWGNAINQTLQLLSDSPPLHQLIDALHREVAMRDTPDEAILSTLMWVSRHCACIGRRQRLVDLLVARGDWHNAFAFDSAIALRLALECPSSASDRARITEAVSRNPWRMSFSEHQIDALVDANILTLSDRRCAEVAWVARLRTDPLKWWPLALEDARETGHIIAHPWLRKKDPKIARELADAVVNHFREAPSLVSADELLRLNDEVLDELAARDLEDLPPRVGIAVEFRMFSSGGDPAPMWRSIAAKMRSGPQHLRDILAFGPVLEEQLGWKPANPEHSSLIPVARAAAYFDSLNGDFQFEPELTLTEYSLPLAEAIIDGLGTDSIDTASRVETVLWALCVLAVTPSAKTFDKLLRLRLSAEQPAFLQDVEFAWIDAAAFTAVMNGHDWKLLVAEARQDIEAERRLGRSGLILCISAVIWSTNRRVREVDRQAVSAQEAVAMYRDGLECILLSGEEFPYTDESAALPEVVSQDLRIELCREVLRLTDGFPDSIARSFRVAAERTLAEAGALAYFYPAIARTFQ
ncbi:hypothetical protein GCM10025783_03120 [Amnibacterium soli]|uniref:NACHT domain-containing protein n=1 Tax=Amnibacterium soli TaxID=1282736 RepID=A0ABP8YPV4_9MICO